MTSKKTIYYILASFVIGNLLLVYMQYNSTRNIDGLLKGNEQLLNEFRVDEKLKSLEKSILNIEKDVQNTIVSGDSAYQMNIPSQTAEVNRNLRWLQQLNDDDSSDNFIRKLNYLVQQKLTLSQQVLDTFRMAGKDAAENLFVVQQHKHLTEQIDAVAHSLDNHRKILLRGLNEVVDRNGHRARQWGIVLIILVLISGACVFWFVINRIGRQNELIEQLDASEKKVREAARVKENFLANMSHEIRTPMNAILGFTKLLRKQRLEPAAEEHVQAIQSSGDKLLTIINDILDLSKIEAGMMRIETAPFSIRELLHSVEMMFRSKAREKGLQFVTHVDKNLPDILEGDSTRLTQILVNIIGNAVKFTDSGSITVAITHEGLQEAAVANKGSREAAQQNHKTTDTVSSSQILRLGIQVSDTGIGIAADKLPFVFERFRQAENSVTRHYGGTGLGLSIVKDLVDLQGGSLAVESTLGKGTTFNLVIPYQLLEAGSSTSKPATAGSAPMPLLEKARLLVAEDNTINQQLLRHLLTGWNLDFDMAGNGHEALELLVIHEYDLILMDIQMPEMDGYTATREIRDSLRLSTPIVAMTAHAMAGERDKCLSLGMNDYISKPIDEDVLYRLIARFTGNKRLAAKRAISTSSTTPSGYAYINLQYMKEVGGGDKEYERTITEQFLEVIPEELAAMEQTWQSKDFKQLAQLAHNMKTSVSVMGLTDSLRPALDALELGPYDEALLREQLDRVQDICLPAMEEARQFYDQLTHEA